MFLCHIILAIIFFIFWALSQKLKLPKYQNQQEARFGNLDSYSNSVASLDVENQPPEISHDFDTKQENKNSIN